MSFLQQTNARICYAVAATPYAPTIAQIANAFIEVDTDVTGAAVVTLPAMTEAQDGWTVIVKNDGAAAIDVTPTGVNIDGAATYQLAADNDACLIVFSFAGGANDPEWHIAALQ